MNAARPIREPEDIQAAGIEYASIPVGHSRGDDETLKKILALMRANVGQRKVFYHCASGNRCGATLIPYLMLDQEFTEEEAVTAAMRMGTRSSELIEWALEFVKKQGG